MQDMTYYYLRSKGLSLQHQTKPEYLADLNDFLITWKRKNFRKKMISTMGRYY